MLLDKTFTKIMGMVNTGGGDSTKERFYIRHVTCALVGAMIAKRLDILRFDIHSLAKWSNNHLKRLRNASLDLQKTASDRVSYMMADLIGGFIITKEFENIGGRHGKTEQPLVPVRGKVTGRIALGTKEERGRVFVTARAADVWCKEHGINAMQFRRELVLNGFIRELEAERVYLGKGVPTQPIGPQRCLELEFSKMQGIVSDVVPTPIVSVAREEAVAG